MFVRRRCAIYWALKSPSISKSDDLEKGSKGTVLVKLDSCLFGRSEPASAEFRYLGLSISIK
jgi:hypothetical protein